ncbi:MAG TPA: xanthine dehydrogenase [Sneathiellales bacterium]|nr:xanthine dehydrogenase [Sneathiellales bacterium]
MRSETLYRLLDDRAQKRSVVLATNLKSNEQILIYPFDNNTKTVNKILIKAACEAAHVDKGRTVETPDGEVFLNFFNPPLRMIIVGAVHISQPLSVMAEVAGYQVIVVDPRRAFATPERFPGMELRIEWPDEALEELGLDRRTAVVSLTHDPKLDDSALSVALHSEAFYIGALGSKRSHAKRVERLKERGLTDDFIAQIHGPIGLDIGARSPSEIAVSILAQVTERLRRPGLS